MQVSINAFLRNPPISGRSHQQLYGEFLEMMEYADQNGVVRVSLAEHHFEDDGYLPSQFVMAGAIAARTTRIEIWFGIMVLPLHHPLSVAEDGAVLDCLSGGRFTLGVAGGYHHKEFDGFGVPRNERAARMDESLDIIRRCWEDEGPFDYDGRFWKLKGIKVRPRPVQQPRPKIMLGGNSEAAARRAARYADGFMPVGARWLTPYRDEMLKLGKDPGPELPRAPEPHPFHLHVARDPERAWDAIAPHALHEWNAYAKYNDDDPNMMFFTAPNADILKERGIYRVMTPEECAEFLLRQRQALGDYASLNLRPTMGGMPAELGQECLELVVNEVLPRVRDADVG